MITGSKFFMKTVKVAVISGVIAAIIGIITYLLNWYLFDLLGGPLPGYQLFLFPGRLTLVYFWHPLFTEEIRFLGKLVMLTVGQFVLVTLFVGISTDLCKRVKRAKPL